MLQNTLARFCFGCAAAVGLLTLAIPARADVPLTLYNAGFEIQNPFDQTAGCGSSTPCYNYSIVGWSQDRGSSGTFDPTTPGDTAFAPPAHEGNNVAWLSSGAYIAQDLGDLSAGTYSISVWVATRELTVGSSSEAEYRLGVGTGGDAASPLWTSWQQTTPGATAPANPNAASDNWALVPLVFTVPTGPTGDWYAFVANDGTAGSGSTQLEVDAPEPLALLLLVIMIGCLALFRPKSARFE